MFLNGPALRAEDNTRTTTVVATSQPESQSQSQVPSPFSTSMKATSDIALCLQLSRATPSTVTLTNFRTNEVLYTVHDTGRGSLSRKPDYEVFRGDSDKGLFVGSIRIGKTGVDVKLPGSERKIGNVEEWTLGEEGARLARWEVATLGRGGTPLGSVKSQTGQAEDGTIAVLECRDQTTTVSEVSGGDNETKAQGEKICTVKLIDVFPNGCLEVWDPKANVDAGGDWKLLDEIVTVSYANMEKARRRCMMGSTQGSIAAGYGGMPAFMFSSAMGGLGN